MAAGEPVEPPITVRDRRRFDPATGEVRAPVGHATDAGGQGVAEAPATPVPGPGGEPAPVQPPEHDALAAQLAERTDDLLRLKAEFDNYRRRVERDRVLVSEQAAARVVAELLPALDDVDRARAHGALDGAFRSVAETVEKVVSGLGVQRYGAVGDAFDPQLHEALQHTVSAEATEPSVVDVYRAGYTAAGRVLRPAQVVVAGPAT